MNFVTRVTVNPELIQWACDRAGFGEAALIDRFPKIEEWQRGELQPTLKQLEAFAKATHTPIGYLFLPAPPVEQVPIPDFRTIGNEAIGHPSPDLLDTIYICQQRQEWYRDFARSNGDRPRAFVGSAKQTDDAVAVAERMRSALAFSIEERRQCPSWTEALRRFIEQADAIGVLVMVNGVVGSNNRRKLDSSEFRGFALVDALAPLIFINGADTKAAQMFTLAHELAHLWLGESALSDASPLTTPANEVEVFCNRVAAELLVPLAMLREEHRPQANLNDEVSRLARLFKVSTLVVLRRIYDAGRLTRERFWSEYEAELARLRQVARAGGGDFYLTTAARVGKRFARAIITDTLEGRTLFRDACRMLGFAKLKTFGELSHSVGVGD
jgi:Zn-dependent peptidase ImmA (M78 family)